MLDCPRCRARVSLRDVYRPVRPIACRACGAKLKFGLAPTLFARGLQAALFAAALLCLERADAQPMLAGIGIGALLTIVVVDLMFVSFTTLREKRPESG